MAIANPEAEAAKEARGTKRKRGTSSTQLRPVRWRTEADQRLYSSKLFAALRRVRSAAPGHSTPRSRLVRDAAYRVLAVAARGRTRWSRAILAARPAVRLIKARKPKAAASPPRPSRSPRRRPEAKGRSSVVERKARVLGRLVPGCRKAAFPTLLDETSDYIAALEMQIRAMAALSDLLSSSGSPAPAQRS